MEFSIKPFQVPKIAVRMVINVNVVLDEKAVINVLLYEDGSEFTPIDVKVITIEGDAYKKWGNDDNYIKNIVFQTLGINKL